MAVLIAVFVDMSYEFKYAFFPILMYLIAEDIWVECPKEVHKIGVIWHLVRTALIPLTF